MPRPYFRVHIWEDTRKPRCTALPHRRPDDRWLQYRVVHRRMTARFVDQKPPSVIHGGYKVLSPTPHRFSGDNTNAPGHHTCGHALRVGVDRLKPTHRSHRARSFAPQVVSSASRRGRMSPPGDVAIGGGGVRQHRGHDRHRAAREVGPRLQHHSPIRRSARIRPSRPVVFGQGPQADRPTDHPQPGSIRAVYAGQARHRELTPTP